MDTGRLTFLGLVDAAVAQHPSMVGVPADFDPVSVPLCVAVGDQDSLLSMDDVKKFKDILDAKSIPTEVTVYEVCQAGKVA